MAFGAIFIINAVIWVIIRGGEVVMGRPSPGLEES